MYIEPFGVEIWMNEWETRCQWNLAETCVDSLTIAELLELAGADESALQALLPMKMTYGAIVGSERLRKAVSSLYAHQDEDNILITHGTIGANMLVHKTVVEQGDRVVVLVPTYQQHYSIPESLGADVCKLQLREDNGFLPDPDELRRLVIPGTRLIAMNNPNNPTGALMDDALLNEMVEIARHADAWLLCDEVYRGTAQQDPGLTTSIVDLYEKGISTAGMSKAFSLAGLRLGWVAANRELLARIAHHRDYDTISVGMVDEYFATLALENHAALLNRSQAITRGNLALLDRWVEQQNIISWVKPRAGTTALLKYDLPVDSRTLCIDLLDQEGVMFTPGQALDMEGYLRIGYANSPAVLNGGLSRVTDFLKRYQV